MKIVPAIGMALIREDKRDFGDAPIDIPDQAIKGVGTQGVIVAVTNLKQGEPCLYFEALKARLMGKEELSTDVLEILKKFCSDMEIGRDAVPSYNEGDHVVFSRFNEQIFMYENGKEYLFYSVPVQSILGILHDA